MEITPRVESVRLWQSRRDSGVVAQEKYKDTCTVKHGGRKGRVGRIVRTSVAINVEEQDFYRTASWFCFVGARRGHGGIYEPCVPPPLLCGTVLASSHSTLHVTWPPQTHHSYHIALSRPITFRNNSFPPMCPLPP